MTDFRMSRLERDLFDNAKDRLRRWIEDTVMRCEAADLDKKRAVCMIMTALSEEVAYGFAALAASREDFLTVMQQVFEHELRKKARKVGEKPCE